MNQGREPRPEVNANFGEGRIASFVAWAVQARVGVLVGLLLCAALAIAMARQLELDALPDVTGNQVIVLTRAPGLTPEELELTVTRPIEVALGGLPRLEEQRSLSRYGISSVVAEFEDGADPWVARQQVSQALSTLPAMPAGVEAPEIAPFTGGLGEVLQLSVNSDRRTPAELRELVVFELAPTLRAVPGVVEINIWGGERRTLDVIADPFALARAGLTFADLADQMRAGTGTAPGSQLSAGPGQALLRGVNWPEDPAALGEMGIHVPPRRDASGNVSPAPVRLSELGQVVTGALPRIGAATANGEGETVYVMVQMLRDANALEVTDRLHELLPELQAALPGDVHIDTVYDRSDLVEATLDTVAKSLLEGAALVILVLFFMLGSIRAGLLVALVIPLSMLGALAWMVVFDIPGNLMSLGAIDFGLLVDGAVVMVERVFHEFAVQREGKAGGDAERTSREVAVRAMKRVAAPMTISVLVITLVYIPILSLEGVDGKMFRPMALTVVFALTTSLVLALTFVPAAASWLRPRDLPRRRPWLVRTMEAGYRPLLLAAIAHPVRVALTAVSLLALGGVALSASGSAFVPQLDEGDLVIQTNRAPDISLETSVRESAALERAVLHAAPEVLSVTSRIGSPEVATDIMGLEQADVFVDLAAREDWRPGLSADRLVAEIRSAIERKAPGAEPTFTQPIQMRFNEILGGSVTDVGVSVYGEDRAEIREVAEALKAELSEVAGASDVRILAPPSVSMVELRPRLLEASQLGMSPVEILDLVRALQVGVVVGETWDGPVRLPIRLRLAHDADAFTVAKVQVVTPRGEVVELGRIAEVVTRETPALVNRHMARRRIIVGFNVRGGELGEVVARAQARVDAKIRTRPGVRLEWGGQFAQLEAAKGRLKIVIPAVLLVIFGLLIASFRRFRPAAIIFLNVPFAVVGGAAALWARGIPISISAAIGFIALSGIAILNGVVLMSSILEKQQAGLEAAEAAKFAALERMRPVMMTALVAALGFVPMMLATGVGAEVQRPLATVVVGGLLTSTFLSLVILPSLFPWLAGRGEGRGTQKLRT